MLSRGDFREYDGGRRMGDSRLRGNDVMGDSRLRGNDGMGDSRLRGNDDSRGPEMTARRRRDVGSESYQGGLNGLAGIGVGEGG